MGDGLERKQKKKFFEKSLALELFFLTNTSARTTKKALKRKTDGQMENCTDRQTDEQTGSRKNDGQINRQTDDGQTKMCRRLVGQAKRQVVRWINEQMDRQTGTDRYRQTDKRVETWMDKQTSLLGFVAIFIISLNHFLS